MSYASDYAANAGNLILEAGNAKARGQQATGQAFGQALATLGDIAGHIPQQLAQVRQQQQEDALRADAIQKAQQQQADTVAIDRAQQPIQAAGADDASQAPRTAPTRQQILDALPGHLKPIVQKQFDDTDKNAAEVQKTQLDLQTATDAHTAAVNEHLAGLGYAVVQHQGDPTAAKIALDEAKKTYANDPQMLQQIGGIEQQIASNPDPKQIMQLGSTLASGSEKYAALMKKPDVTAVTLAQDAATLGTPQETPTAKLSAAALEKLKPPKTGADTEAELDARAQVLYAKRRSGTPLTKAENDELGAYEDRKTAVTDASAQVQQAQQKRSQDFAEAQAGRAELTTKVEQPYLDAKEKADTLRNVVAASKTGNMVAGNVQSLLGTLGLVTTEGVKRINSTELAQVSGAGSLLEKIKGAAGKVAAGQPLPPKLQDDLVQLAGLLEQSARKKYESGFGATTKRYGLSDETMIPDGSAQPAGGLPAIGDTFNGGKVLKVEKVN